MILCSNDFKGPAHDESEQKPATIPDSLVGFAVPKSLFFHTLNLPNAYFMLTAHNTTFVSVARPRKHAKQTAKNSTGKGLCVLKNEVGGQSKVSYTQRRTGYWF